MTHRSDAAATQECLASVFTRALAEDRTVEFVPLPKDSVIKRVAASVGKENDARLTGREAQDLLHELELRPESGGAETSKGDHRAA